MKQSNNITAFCPFDYKHNGISVYIENTYEFYLPLEQLCKQAQKIYNKCGGLDADILCNCSTLKAITRQARKQLAKFGEAWTMTDDRQAREALTAYIYDWCQA